MHLPRVVAAALGIRQVGNLLPVSYCSPECPNCKADVAVFDGSTTSCTPNSSFISNCGQCQTCVITYNIQTGETQLSNQIELALVNILNLCANTSVSTEIAELQSQAVRYSSWAESKLGVATTTSGTLVSSSTTAPTPTATGTELWAELATEDPSWTTVMTTATYGSQYSSWASAVSAASTSLAAASLSSLEASRANQTAVYTSPTASALATSTAAPNAKLSQSWVAGPVMGSVLGMSTVFIVIFFTRRRQRRDMPDPQDSVPKPFHDIPTSPSTRASSAAGDIQEVHSESVEAKELESTEVHELPALEPVGSELNTPMAARPKIRLGGESIAEDDEDEENFTMQSPLPLSPLPLLFAMSELRDQRMGRSESLRHETYYHP